MSRYATPWYLAKIKKATVARPAQRTAAARRNADAVMMSGSASTGRALWPLVDTRASTESVICAILLIASRFRNQYLLPRRRDRCDVKGDLLDQRLGLERERLPRSLGGAEREQLEMLLVRLRKRLRAQD